jgi:hypothetical protein
MLAASRLHQKFLTRRKVVLAFLGNGICDKSPAAYLCRVIPLFESDMKNNYCELAS